MTNVIHFGAAQFRKEQICEGVFSLKFRGTKSGKWHAVLDAINAFDLGYVLEEPANIVTRLRIVTRGETSRRQIVDGLADRISDALWP